MPIVQALMDALTKKYGAERGKSVYYAMEAEGSGPFAKGAKHHDLHVAFAAKHHLRPIESKGKKKPATPKGRRARRART